MTTEPRTLSVLLGQVIPPPADVAAGIELIERAVAEHGQADLAVFPELAIGGYRPAQARELAIAADGAEIAALRALAGRHRTAIVAGFAERTAGRPANSAVIIDRDGELRGIYRKVQLYGAEEAREFIAGEEFMVAELCGVRCGLMICFDIDFPEPARALAQAGCELLVTASANMDPFARDHELQASVRALENHLPHVYVNRSGSESGLDFAGGSTIVSADGEVIAALGRGPQIAVCELPLAGPGPDRAFDIISMRRPDVVARVV